MKDNSAEMYCTDDNEGKIVTLGTYVRTLTTKVYWCITIIGSAIGSCKNFNIGVIFRQSFTSLIGMKIYF